MANAQKVHSIFRNGDYLRQAQQKWDRLTVLDFTSIRTLGQLSARVQKRYSLPLSQAQRDVAIWSRDKQLW